MSIKMINETASRLRENIKKVITGKEHELNIIISAILAKGHILLEDIPGTGKTVMAKAIAKSIDGEFKRVQFTPDLLPGDITGVHVYNLKSGEFTLKKGAVFTNILLGDEINRATPRTQSALLECMEERQVTIDGITFPLTEPFLVLATQNPIETAGTFPLPEAQLDRFLIEISLGYPSEEAELEILEAIKFKHPVEDIQPVVTGDDLNKASLLTEQVLINKTVLEYIRAIGTATRNHEKIRLGLSVRGLLSLKRMAQSFAAVNGCDFVTPDHVKSVAPYVIEHRLILKDYALRQTADKALSPLREILAAIPVPTEEA